MQPGAQPWLKVDLLQHDTGGNQVIKDIIRRRMQRHAGDNIEGTEQADEAGFTLVELMVVVLIIAILMAVAIPTYLGARSRAQHSAAVQDLVNAVTAAQTVYATNNSSYAPPASAPTSGCKSATFTCLLQNAEPSLQFTDGPTIHSDSNSISIGVGGGSSTNGTGAPQSIMMAAYDQSGKCDVVLEIANSDSSAINTLSGATSSGSSPTSAGAWYATFKPSNGTCDVASAGSGTSSSTSTTTDSTYSTTGLTLLTGWTQTPPAS